MVVRAQHLSLLAVFSENVFGMWNKSCLLLLSFTQLFSFCCVIVCTHELTHALLHARNKHCSNYQGRRKHCFYIVLSEFPTFDTTFSGCKGFEFSKTVKDILRKIHHFSTCRYQFYFLITIYRLLGQVLGKIRQKKSLRPPFLSQKKSSPPYFFLKKSLRSPFLVEKVKSKNIYFLTENKKRSIERNHF